MPMNYTYNPTDPTPHLYTYTHRYIEAIALAEANPLVTRAFGLFVLGTCEAPIALNRERAIRCVCMFCILDLSPMPPILCTIQHNTAMIILH